MTRAVYFRLLVGWRLAAQGHVGQANRILPKRWKLPRETALDAINRLTRDILAHNGQTFADLLVDYRNPLFYALKHRCSIEGGTSIASPLIYGDTR